MARLFVIVFFLLSAAPLVQMNYRFLPEFKLSGVERVRERPSLAPETIASGSFASGFDEWFSSNIGFRGAFVKTDNQLNFSLFREISATAGSPVVLGKQNTLFEKSYIDAYNNANRLDDEPLRGLAARLARLQALLAERRMAFLVVISPSKARILKERLPDRFVDEVAAAQPTNYDRLVKFLAEAGVNTLDGPRMFEELKGSAPYPLFARGGTHWSYYGSCLVSQQIVLALERQLGGNLRHINCSKVVESPVPKLMDRDLTELVNLWRPEPMRELLGYPKRGKLVSKGEDKPRLLFVGSSFLWTILHYFDKFKAYTERDMFYYYSTNYRHTGEKIKLDRAAIDWPAQIFVKNAVILESNEAAVEGIGYGFVEDAIAALERAGGGVASATLSRIAERGGKSASTLPWAGQAPQ